MLLNKIKSLWTKEEACEEIARNQILSFIETQKKRTSNTETNIKTVSEQIRQATKKLEEGEIDKDINVHETIKQKVLGSRKAYCIMLYNVCLQVEKEENPFPEFIQRSQKAYVTTKYLFGKDLEPILPLLKELEKARDERQKQKEQQQKQEAAEQRLNQLLAKNKKEELEAIEQEREQWYPGNSKHELEQIKTNDNLYQHEKKRKKAEEELNLIKQELIEIFSPLKRPLKKYNNVHKETLLTKYEEDYLQALKDDETYEIKEKIPNINLLVFEEDIKKQEQVTKALEKIRKLPFLRTQLIEKENKYEELKKETIWEREIKEKEQEYKKYQQKYDELTKRKEEKQHEREPSNEELEELIYQITKKRVKIKT